MRRLIWGPRNKKGRVSVRRSRPGSRNFVRLLAAYFIRARLAGPLPRKGEAVGKGEIFEVRVHRALSNTLSVRWIRKTEP